MTAVVYVDSSAIVKLAWEESESVALRTHLGDRALVSSGLARTEVLRALLDRGPEVLSTGRMALAAVDLIRISDRVLEVAAELSPPTLRSLDAIHLATAEMLRPDLDELVTYDRRMADVARAVGHDVSSPS